MGHGSSKIPFCPKRSVETRERVHEYMCQYLATTVQSPGGREGFFFFFYVGRTTMLGISHIPVQQSSGRANVNLDDITGRQED